jgi:hypothetical protein
MIEFDIPYLFSVIDAPHERAKPAPAAPVTLLKCRYELYARVSVSEKKLSIHEKRSSECFSLRLILLRGSEEILHVTGTPSEGNRVCCNRIVGNHILDTQGEHFPFGRSMILAESPNRCILGGFRKCAQIDAPYCSLGELVQTAVADTPDRQMRDLRDPRAHPKTRKKMSHFLY